MAALPMPTFTAFASVANMAVAMRYLRNLRDGFGIKNSEIIERLQKTPIASAMQDSEGIEDLLSTLDEMYDDIGAGCASVFLG